MKHNTKIAIHSSETSPSKQPNYKLRRAVAAAALLTAPVTLFALGKRIAEKIDSDVARFSVNLEEVHQLSPEEREGKYEKIVVMPGDNLWSIANDYAERNELNVDRRDIVSALNEQGDTSVVHAGDTFYLQRQEKER